MLKWLVAPLLLGLLSSTAFAATCPLTSVQVKDNLGNTANMSIADDGSGNGTCQTFGEAQIVTAIKNPPGLGTTGGWTPLHIHNLAATVTTVKAAPGQLGLVQCDNQNGSTSYVQIFNALTGSVTLGTTPPTQTVPIQANSSNGFTLNLVGMQYSTAISVAATSSDNGNTAPGTGLNCNFGYN